MYQLDTFTIIMSSSLPTIIYILDTLVKRKVSGVYLSEPLLASIFSDPGSIKKHLEEVGYVVLHIDIDLSFTNHKDSCLVYSSGLCKTQAFIPKGKKYVHREHLYNDYIFHGISSMKDVEIASTSSDVFSTRERFLRECGQYRILLRDVGQDIGFPHLQPTHTPKIYAIGEHYHPGWTLKHYVPFDPEEVYRDLLLLFGNGFDRYGPSSYEDGRITYYRSDSHRITFSFIVRDTMTADENEDVMIEYIVV